MLELDLELLLEFLLRKARAGGRSRQRHKAPQLETTQLSLHRAADILWKGVQKGEEQEPLSPSPAQGQQCQAAGQPLRAASSHICSVINLVVPGDGSPRC